MYTISAMLIGYLLLCVLRAIYLALQACDFFALMGNVAYLLKPTSKPPSGFVPFSKAFLEFFSLNIFKSWNLISLIVEEVSLEWMKEIPKSKFRFN